MASYGLVQLRWKRDRPTGQPAEDVMVNTIHCQVTDGGWTTDDRDAFNGAFATFWAAVNDRFSSQVGPTEHRFYNMPATAGPLGDPAFTTLDPTQVGTASLSATLPPQVAITVTWKTAIRRRWGRIYLGGLTSGAVNNGRIDASTLTELANAIDAFGTALRGSGQGIVVWHRAGWSAEDVTDFTIDDVFDVQRRRRYDHASDRRDGSFTS
jgi:hypothetical protein